jgi:hypothetical protein
MADPVIRLIDPMKNAEASLSVLILPKGGLPFIPPAG